MLIMETKHIKASKLFPMNSGHLCLEFSENIDWEVFPEFASGILKKLNGRVINKIDTVEMRLWDVVIDRVKLRFVWDDYPYMISLESDSDAGDSLLKKMFESLNQNQTTCG